MDRLEIAQKNYARIVPEPYQLDEEKSEELEAWLREDVVAVVTDLLEIPAFRRFVSFGPKRLAAETDTEERLQVEAVSDAMIEVAREIVKLGHRDEFKELMKDWDPLEEMNQKESTSRLTAGN